MQLYKPPSPPFAFFHPFLFLASHLPNSVPTVSSCHASALMARNLFLIPFPDLLNPDPRRRDGPTWGGPPLVHVQDFNQSLPNWLEVFLLFASAAEKCETNLSGAFLTPFCTKLVKVCVCVCVEGCVKRRSRRSGGEKKKRKCVGAQMTSCSPQRATISPLKKRTEWRGEILNVLTGGALIKRKETITLIHRRAAASSSDGRVRDFFFESERESLKRCPGERDWRLFFRWLSNDWMWLAQIISLITAQQAQIGPRARPSPPPAALHAFNQPCQPESHGAETGRFLQSEIPPVTEETDLWSLDYVKMLY